MPYRTTPPSFICHEPRCSLSGSGSGATRRVSFCGGPASTQRCQAGLTVALLFFSFSSSSFLFLRSIHYTSARSGLSFSSIIRRIGAQADFTHIRRGTLHTRRLSDCVIRPAGGKKKKQPSAGDTPTLIAAPPPIWEARLIAIRPSSAGWYRSLAERVWESLLAR